ncbi:UdgX family uracil-DNA binding protein [Ideonella sp. BN130291]|uniref:UdgX family uracil-DNA binding protein n=1 Tax=Ideonella sp. BN130291 TaxID=3112940 RepID=UPI002E253B89|nr:UdgX family uracil-DNA binding protein [Ideonella sp. BN130291]MED5620986.1 UdgX family uracil-DNA binding protein [Ideonella sp. BN130291]
MRNTSPSSSPAVRARARAGSTATSQPKAVVTLHTVAEQAAGCRECPIGFIGTQTVWGEGPVGAPLMLVGEQPGDHEDLQGRPFVGPAGALLDRALAQLHWPRERLYVTNAVKHFKFELRGKRRMHKTPAQREVAACNHWLQSEIELVGPQAIVALGATAARATVGQAVPVMSQRGQWLQRTVDGLPVLITLHPSALLRLRGGDRDEAFAAWLHDLQQAARYMRAD